MSTITHGIAGRAIASIAERHTTVTGTSYQNAGGIATVERVPLVCTLSSTTVLLVTQGSRDNGSDYHFNEIRGRIVTVAQGANGPYVASVGEPFLMYTLAAYDPGVEWLNIGSLSRVPDDRGRVHLLFTVYTGTAGAIERSYALHLYSDNASLGTSSTWNTPLRGTYSSGYTNGTDEISEQVIKVDDATPAGMPTCYTAGDNSRDDVWDHFAFGPGNIEKLSDGTLVAFADHRYRVTSATAADKIPYSHSIYSTDDGDTWQLGGGYVENAADANAYTNEICGVVVNSSDDLFVSSRITSGGNQNARATTTITDHTANWSTPSITTDLGGNDCSASLCAASVGGTLYHQMLSNVNTDLSTLRCHIGVWKSTNAGSTWTYCKTICHEISAYSAIACLDGTNFVSFFEHNRDVVEVDSFAQDIKTAAFDSTWLDDSTAYSSVIYYFNEATSGAIPTTGRPIRNYGTAVCGGGYGGSGGTYDSSGIVGSGSAVAAVLQSTMRGYNQSTGLNQRGGPCDLGTDAFTLTFVGLNLGTTTAARVVASNRGSAGTSSGWQLITSTSNRYSFAVHDGAAASSAKQSNTNTTTTKRTIVISGTAAGVGGRQIRMWRDDGAGTFTEQGSAVDGSSVVYGVSGAGPLTLGARDDGTSPHAFSMDALIIERGIARTSGFTHSGNLTKQTWDSYNGFSGYTPRANDPETLFTNCKAHLLGRGDGGYGCKTDIYGYYPGKITRQSGDPVNSYRDLKTPSRVWTLASNARGIVQVQDATVGTAFRLQFVSGSGNGYLTCPASSDFNFNTDGVFTLIFPIIQFRSSTGSNQVIFDQCTGSAANSGLYIARVNSSGAINLILTKGDGSNTLISESTFGSGAGFGGLSLGTAYYLAFVGAGAGAKMKMYVGAWTSSTQPPTLTAYDSGSNMAAVAASPAACGAPYIGVRNDGNTSSLADIERLAEISISRDTATANQLALLAEGLLPGGVALRGGGHSLGLDLGI
jgi:hypothetical protein